MPNAMRSILGGMQVSLGGVGAKVRPNPNGPTIRSIAFLQEKKRKRGKKNVAVTLHYPDVRAILPFRPPFAGLQSLTAA